MKSDLVKEVLEDFERRAIERKPFETQWKLNMDFYMGNQFSTIGFGGIVEDMDRQYFWQEREVFNHIAPKVDLRLSKLSAIRPKLYVVPATNDEKDVYTAKLSKKILVSVSAKHSLS